MTEKKAENEDSHQEKWMIRQCYLYKDEHDECTSLKGRFHQYFIFGKMLECDVWKRDFRNCQLWEAKRSEEAYQELIKSEKKRRMDRLRPHYSNNVWKKRDKPPEDWNRPLPEWMEKDFENSFLDHVNKRIKNNQTHEFDLRTACTIL